MKERIPEANTNKNIEYLSKLRTVLAEAVRKLARVIEGKSEVTKKEKEQIDETRRNLLRGGLFFAASAAAPSQLSLSATKLRSLNLSPENFAYLAKLININGSSNDALLGILESFTNNRSVFDELKSLSSFLESGQLTQMDEKDWLDYLDKNAAYLRSSWRLAASWVNKDFDLAKLKDPSVYSALESL